MAEKDKDLEKQLNDEIMEVAEKHLSKFTTGALQKRLNSIDGLEKQVKQLEKEKQEEAEEAEETIAGLKKQLAEKTAEVNLLQSYKNKEAELNTKAADLEKKEFQLTTKTEAFEEIKALHKEGKKEIYDLVNTVFSSQIKTEKISKIFSEIPITNPDGSTVVKKDGETTEKKSS